jgi:nucleotide-binding universal stress UspA family protein
MKRILVPIDFSEQAEHAMKTAAQIARKSGGKIFLLHMLNLPSDQTDMDPSADASSPAKMLYLSKIHEKFEDLKDVDYMQGTRGCGGS